MLGLLKTRTLPSTVEERCLNLATMTVKDKKVLKDNANKKAENKFITNLFICIADTGRYGELKTRLADNFALGDNKYPHTLTAALALLRDFEGVAEGGREQRNNNNNSSNKQQAAKMAMSKTTAATSTCQSVLALHVEAGTTQLRIAKSK